MKTTQRSLAMALVSLPAVLLSSQAVAEFSYDFLELSYGQTQIDFGSEAVDDLTLRGAGVAGSVSLGSHLVIGGRFNAGQGESSARFQAADGQGVFQQAIDVETTGPEIYALVNLTVGPTTNLMVGGSYAEGSSSVTRADGQAVPALSVDTESKVAFAGLRQKVGTNLELNARIDYDVDAEGSDDADKFSQTYGARFLIDSALDIGLSYSPSDDGDTAYLSARHYF